MSLLLALLCSVFSYSSAMKTKPSIPSLDIVIFHHHSRDLQDMISFVHKAQEKLPQVRGVATVKRPSLCGMSQPEDWGSPACRNENTHITYMSTIAPHGRLDLFHFSHR